MFENLNIKFRKYYNLFNSLPKGSQGSLIVTLILVLSLPLFMAYNNRSKQIGSKATTETAVSAPILETKNYAAHIENGTDGLISDAKVTTKEFTLEAWVKTQDFTPDNEFEDRYIYIQENQEYASKLGIYLKNDTKKGMNGKNIMAIGIVESGNLKTITIGDLNSIIPTNTWNHFAFTSDGNTLRFFVNGKLKGSTAAVMGGVSQPAYANAAKSLIGTYQSNKRRRSFKRLIF